MNSNALLGVGLVLVGVLVLVFPSLLQVLVGLGFILAGLWIAMRNAPSHSNI